MNYKKIGIGLLVAIALISGAVAVVSGGYKLFTATSHFSVSEGTEVQYWNGASWMSLAVDGSTFDLGQVDIKPGETNTFALRARNNASNGVIGIKLQIETIDGITHDVLCRQDSNGLQYTKGTDVYLFKAPADNVWRAVDITTSISGDFPVGNVEFGNTLTRHNAETTYAITCGV